MKTQHNRRAFTAVELAVVICVIVLLVVFASMFAPQRRVYAKASRIQCVNNQKQIGLAYRIWAGDNNDRYPADAPNTYSNGGWHDFTLLTNAGQYAWSNFTIMQNELGQSPKVLVCPSDDERTAATSFSNFSNKNLSYFIAPGGNEIFPLSILGGDRNLAPGTTPKNDFGYSPKSGNGNDVILQTNSPVCWSLKIHSAGTAVGAGNILLADGSVQQCSSARLMSDYTAFAAVPSNFPSGFNNSQSNSFRLIFP